MVSKPRTNPELRRGDGSWGYDEDNGKITLRHMHGGKRWIERGESHDDCIAKRNRRRRDLDVKASLEGDGTLGDVLDQWFLWKQFKSSSTQRSYTTSRENMLEQFGGPGMQLADLTVADVEKALLRLVVDGGWRDSTLDKFFGHWRQMLKFAERRRLITPEKFTELFRAEAPQAHGELEKRWFDLVEYDIVSEYLLRNREPKHVVHMVMLLAGLRPGEALGLRWEYVDLIGRTLRVEGQIERRYRVYSTVLKTDHLHPYAHREVPIAGDLALVLGELHQSAGRPSEGPVFEINYDVMAAATRNIALANKVTYVNPNGYRHTFASVCRHNGMPYEVLAKLMGHKDASMIVKTYGHPIVPSAAVDIERYLSRPEQ